MSHTKLPRVCGLACALALGLTATASADQTFTVPCAGPTATTGPTGLLNRINQANAAPVGTKTTIKLDSGCAYVYRAQNNSDADGPNALPVIVREIVLDGEPGGRENALIERSAAGTTPSFRLFKVAANGTLTLKNITVSGGRTPNGANGSNGPAGGNGGNAPDGGGILNLGAVTLQHSILTRNVTGNGGDGGQGTLLAGGNGGNGGNGGGIANRGTLTSKDGSSTSGNVTGDGGNGGNGNTDGGNGGKGGDGGGLYRSAGTAALRDSSTVSGNATGNGGNGGDGNNNGGNGGNGGGGGGVAGRNAGTGLQLNGGGVLVGDNTTGNGGNGGSGNAAGGNGGNGGDGGGSFLDASGLAFSDSALTGNATGTGGSGNGGGTNGTGGNGGGLAAENGSTATLNKGSITFNTAATGGAIFASSSTVTVNGTKIANNSTPQCVGTTC